MEQSKMECPLCGCVGFYIKDPDDEYETYEFAWRDGNVEFRRGCGSRQAVPKFAMTPRFFATSVHGMERPRPITIHGAIINCVFAL